jgi:hypothetical protein
MRRSARTSILVRFFCAMICVCGLLLFAPLAFAQQDPMGTIAGQIANDINQSKAKHRTVGVFFFAGPHGSATPLGREISEEFNSAFVQLHAKFHLIDEKSVDVAFPAEQMAPSAVSDAKLMQSTAQDMNWEVAIDGTFTIEQDTIVLGVSSILAQSGETTTIHTVRIPMTD